MKQPRFIPIYLSIALVLGMVIGKNFSGNKKEEFENSNRFSSLAHLFQTIEENYVDSVNLDSIEEVVIKEVLEKLDPHSYYIQKKQVAKVNESLKSNFSGIGVEYRMIDGKIQITRVIPDGPADEAGLKFGDQVIGIHQNIFTLDQAQDLVDTLRGEKGTSIEVMIRRQSDTLHLPIIRGEIPLYSTFGNYFLDSSTFYIKIDRFSEKTYAEFASQLNQQSWKKLVIDLRGNGGGFLDASTQMAELFLDANVKIVSTEGRMYPEEVYTSVDQGKYINRKVFILIDKLSASASEVFTGALKDNNKAIVLGDQSFGKGLVQNQFKLPNGGAFRLTIARYFTPSGICIQRPYEGLDNESYLKQKLNKSYGISPDYFVKPQNFTAYNYAATYYFDYLVDSVYFLTVKNSSNWLAKYPKCDVFSNEFKVEDEWLKSINIPSEIDLEALKSIVKEDISHYLYGPDCELYLRNQKDPIFQLVDSLTLLE